MGSRFRLTVLNLATFLGVIPTDFPHFGFKFKKKINKKTKIPFAGGLSRFPRLYSLPNLKKWRLKIKFCNIFKIIIYSLS